MFFALSKILQYIITPVVWMAIILIISFFIKKDVIKKKLRLSVMIIFFVFTNPFLQDEFMRLWEVKAIHQQDIIKPYDYGIVLTGMLTYDNQFERINFLRSTDRILQTLDLYKKGIISKIFITGGSGELLNQKNKEAEILKDYLLLLGIPSEDILIEVNSRNTYENARETVNILNSKKNDNTYLLITSAYHMRRSAACFKKQGLEFDVYPTDRYAGSRKFTPDHLFVPKVDTLQRWNVLLREIVGFITYKIVGYC